MYATLHAYVDCKAHEDTYTDTGVGMVFAGRQRQHQKTVRPGSKEADAAATAAATVSPGCTCVGIVVTHIGTLERDVLLI